MMSYPVCHRKVPLMVESLTNDSPSPTEASSLNSAFLPNHTLTTSVDGVSMVSYSSTYSQNGAGVFRIRDPETRPKPQRTKPAKQLKVKGGPKRRKPTPNLESGADRKGGISYDPQLGTEHISNGAAELSVRAKPRPGAQGSREARCGGAELSHGNVPSQGSLSYSSSDERKRKGPGSSAGSDKPSKTSKSAALDAIFRKSHSGLWSSVADPPHCAPSRQVQFIFRFHLEIATFWFCLFFDLTCYLFYFIPRYLTDTVRLEIMRSVGQRCVCPASIPTAASLHSTLQFLFSNTLQFRTEPVGCERYPSFPSKEITDYSFTQIQI